MAISKKASSRKTSPEREAVRQQAAARSAPRQKAVSAASINDSWPLRVMGCAAKLAEAAEVLRREPWQSSSVICRRWARSRRGGTPRRVFHPDELA